MQSLVITVPGLKWGKDDNKDAMVGRALTYLVLYSTLGMVLRWSYGVKLLTQADDGPSETSPLLGEYGAQIPDQTLRRERTTSTLTRIGLNSVPESLNEQCPPMIFVEDSERRRPNPARRPFYQSFPNSPNESQIGLRDEYSTDSPSSPATSSHFGDSDEGEESVLLPVRRHDNHDVGTPITQNTRRRLSCRCGHSISRAWSTLNSFMTVPLWAALASLLVACIPPIQHAMEWHMQPLKGSLAAAGNCSIPLTLIVLGAYFYPTPSSAEDLHTNLNGVKSSSKLVNGVKGLFKLQKRPRNPSHSPERPGETKTVVIAVISRMIITPMLLLPLMALSKKFDLHDIFEDPVFVVSNVLLISSPPALTLAQITQQAASGDAFERLISRTIFWSYCIITPPATIINVVLGLLLVKL